MVPVIGDLVRVKNSTFLTQDAEGFGIVVSTWNINNHLWLRVLWGSGSIDAIVSADIEIVSDNIDA